MGYHLSQLQVKLPNTWTLRWHRYRLLNQFPRNARRIDLEGPWLFVWASVGVKIVDDDIPGKDWDSTDVISHLNCDHWHHRINCLWVLQRYTITNLWTLLILAFILRWTWDCVQSEPLGQNAPMARSIKLLWLTKLNGKCHFGRGESTEQFPSETTCHASSDGKTSSKSDINWQ